MTDPRRLRNGTKVLMVLEDAQKQGFAGLTVHQVKERVLCEFGGENDPERFFRKLLELAVAFGLVKREVESSSVVGGRGCRNAGNSGSLRRKVLKFSFKKQEVR